MIPMHLTKKLEEFGHVESGRNSLAVRMLLCAGAGSRQLTTENKKGSGHVESRRNSLAVSECRKSILAAQTETKLLPVEPSMQTEIEVLESRENPMIVWY